MKAEETLNDEEETNLTKRRMICQLISKLSLSIPPIRLCSSDNRAQNLLSARMNES